MSFTYTHYQGPSSLPSDYSLISRVVGHHTEPEGDNISTLNESDDTDDTIIPKPSRSFRRDSYGEYSGDGIHDRPRNITIGVYPGTSGVSGDSDSGRSVPTEHTPLLTAPPVPRIEEDIDRDPAHDRDSSIEMFWEELPILTKYALPVFGCV